MSIINKINEIKELLVRNVPKDGYILSFSGGKDSVLLNGLLEFSNVSYKAVYFSTGGESDDFLSYITKICPKLDVIKPKIDIEELIKKNNAFPFNSLYCISNCWLDYSSLFKISKIVITGYKDVDVKDYLDVHPTSHFGQMLYKVPYIKEKDCYTFHPLIDWTDEEVMEAIKYLDIELYRSYAYGVKSYSCPFCHSASKKLSTFLYPDLTEKWKGYAKYCYDNNEEIRQKFASPEAYWQYYLDYDLLSVLRNKSGNESDKNE